MLLAGSACGGERAVDAGRGPPPPAAPPTEVEAMALSPAALREAADDAARRARVAEGSADGVRLARAAAGLARVRALRERDGRRLDDARRLLRTASRNAELPGACDAALELAQLEARDAADLRAAWLAAHRVETRFGRAEPARGCVAEAHRIGVLLAASRPSDADVAAYDAGDEDGLAEPADAGGGAAGAGAGPSDPQIEAWAAAHRAEGQRATLTGVDVPGRVEGADHVRVVLRLGTPVAFARSELVRDGPLPRRLVLDFRDVALDPAVPPATAVGAGGVQRVRVAREDPRTLRVVVDLEDDARAQAFVLAAPYRVVIDADHGRDAEGAAGSARPLSLLVLDPGHGGDDHGAPGPEGLRESRVALELAQRVRAILAQRLPRTRVALTRERDVFVPLEQRTAMANAQGADAFVSIHLNASPTPAETGGVGTFVLDTTNDRASLALAARENGTSEADLSDLSRLLASLERADQARDSRELAEAVEAATLASGRQELPSLGNRGVHAATFYVLVGTEMPSVLVEAAFILRAPEAPLLARATFRQRLAEGIAEGIVRYAAGRR